MLLAYIDEIGETGAFVSRDHARFNTSPAFGYAGFVIPASNARPFGSVFTTHKRTLFRTEIADSDPAHWERKGSDLFRPNTLAEYPNQIRVFNALVGRLRANGGNLFYYADEKPIGTPGQTSLDKDERERSAMQEALNRLARHADRAEENLLVIIDQINEKERKARMPLMYAHILGRAAEFPEMRRIIEPPMHVESHLSSNIQFADWVAACVTRAIDYQLLESSRYTWITDGSALGKVRGAFTAQSKLHLWKRAIADLNHSEVFNRQRVVHPRPQGQLLGGSEHAATWQRIKAAAERAHRQPTKAH